MVLAEGWQRATLAEKIPEPVLNRGPKPVWNVLSREAQGLKVDWEIAAPQEWLQIRARGDDAETFVNLLREKFGEAPVLRSKVERWDVRKGFLTGSGRVGFGVYVDMGILEPARKDALYPLHRMRAQLSDGESHSSREIMQGNGLADYFPVDVIVTELQGENVTVELADGTRDQLLWWNKLLFDRVIAVGIDRDYAEKVVQSANLGLDVIKIETLSLLVQCLVCKLDTDAPGVIAKIGNRLRGVGLTAFKTPAKRLLV
ncbi:hypothetical protein AUI06_06410 [archaeon 13_2_20CM_2_52_21]|nr:MAG: hypothetical protein AUI06_06410 [archaeon 13_2_20CM_2_52_21]